MAWDAAWVRADEAPAEPRATFMWEARSETNVVYLLGSLHLARADFYPLPAEIEAAYERSARLAVEADVVRIDPQDAALMFRLGWYIGPGTLSENLTEPTRELLTAYRQERGLPEESYEKLRPWMAALTISIQEMQKLGYSEVFGIDPYFLHRAHGEGKPVIELESIEQQLNIFVELSDETQDLFLAQTLEEIDEIEADLERIDRAWKTGDAELMEEVIAEFDDEMLEAHPELRRFWERLMDERNVEMVEKIEGFLAEDEPYFVVVGAGHMVGEMGIVELLREKGYEVIQVRMTEPE